MIRFLLAVALLFAAAPTFAATYVGTFKCDYCPLSQPTPDPDTRNFISSDVNLHVSSWIIPGTLMGKRVIICNLVECVVYQYQASGVFLAIASSPIPGAGGGGGGFGGGGGGGSYTGIVGYRPIVRVSTSCALGVCTEEVHIVGYEPIYGTISNKIQ